MSLFSVACSLAVLSCIQMLSKTTHVLLEGVPDGVDPKDLHDKLKAINGVTDVHDLHIWMLSIGRPLVTVHMKANNPHQAMREAQLVFTAAGIDHITIQIQEDTCLPDECDHPCPSLACVSTSPNGNNGGGCSYL
jgi:cobalt-zinc-cadmium efflux system protein